MKRGAACLCAVLIGALLTATSIQSAAKRPRFFATISGTQHFEWTLDHRGEDCSFKGQGEQHETFGTARPVKVIAPLGEANSYEFQAFNGRGWGRTVPLVGRETRVYRVLRAPVGACAALRPQYRSDCRGTNPLLPRAGVTLKRSKQTLSLHVPVDVPWINRTPSVCNILLFDLRNFYLAAVGGLWKSVPVRGGTFENRRAKTLRVGISERACAGGTVDYVDFNRCGSPPRGELTGEIRTSWSITLRRTR
jgi:hypothetical protein